MATLLSELARDTAELTASQTIEGSAMRVFLVQGSSSERATDILAASGLPRVNVDSHPANAYLICKSKRPERMPGARNIWIVSCSYDTAAAAVSGGAAGPIGDEGYDPFLWEADVEIGADQTTLVLFADAENREVANAAGTPYEGGLQVPKALPTLRLTQYEPAVVDVIAKIRTYTNTRNQDTFLQTGDAGKWLCRDIRASKVRVSGQLAWRVSYEVAYDDNKHKVKFLNAGPQVRDFDANNVEVVSAYVDPVYKQPGVTNLTAAGFELPDGDAPNFIEFQPYPEVAWTPMKIRRKKK